MQTVQDFFSKDHHHLDATFHEFQRLEKGDGDRAKALFRQFDAGLRKHIVWEEEILFPLFEDRTGMKEQGPTAVMRMEHAEIKRFLQEIDTALQAKSARTEELERGLVEVLTAHNQKEENILYPWIDETLDEREREEVFDQMKSLVSE